MSRWLICETSYSGEFNDWCLYAMVRLNNETLERVVLAKKGVVAAQAAVSGVWEVRLHDYNAGYLDKLPEEWEEWAEEHLEGSGEWRELPFPVPFEGDDGEEEIVFSRTECTSLVATGHGGGVYWSCYPKHTSIKVETPFFPSFTDLEKLSLCGEEE
jgi:hypothetical protein